MALSTTTNLGFLYGSQKDFNAKTTGFKPGTFYFTTDAHRLYLAQGAGKEDVAELNRYIQIWSNESGAPAYNDSMQVGDIYYFDKQNILAIIDELDTTNRRVSWTQINPDTYLDVNQMDIGVSDNSFVVEVSDSQGNWKAGSVTFTTDAVNGLSNAISLQSTDGQEGSINIFAHDTDRQYNLVGGKGTLTENVNATETKPSQVNISLIDKGDAGKGIDSVAGTITLAGDTTASGITKVSRSNNVITISTPKRPVTEVAAGFSEAGTLTIGVKTEDNTTAAEATVTPKIKYGTSSSNPIGNDAVFNNGTAVLDVYSKSQVDAAIVHAQSEFNAMTYRGTVDSAEVATKLTNNALWGQVYKASGAFALPAISSKTESEINVKAGDLIISEAVNEDAEEGSVNNTVWSVIPSGDDQVINGATSGTSFQITDAITGVATDLLNITIQGSEVLDIDDPGIKVSGNVNGHQNTITVAHGKADPKTSEAFSFGTSVIEISAREQSNQDHYQEIPIITSISKDAAGHITNISGQRYKVHDTHAVLEEYGIVEANNNLSLSVKDTDGKTATNYLQLESDNSDNIKFSYSAKKQSESAPNMNLGAIKINFVWGSF